MYYLAMDTTKEELRELIDSPNNMVVMNATIDQVFGRLGVAFYPKVNPIFASSSRY